MHCPARPAPQSRWAHSNHDHQCHRALRLPARVVPRRRAPQIARGHGPSRCSWQSGYALVPKGSSPDSDEMDDSLGYVDQVAFALLEPLLVCRHRDSGQTVLICGEEDPLRGSVEFPHLDVLGYVDRFPILPHDVPTSRSTRAWLRGLVRIKDGAARRHRISLTNPDGPEGWELGALLDRDPGGGIPAWVDGAGRLHTSRYSPTRHPFDAGSTLRWVGAPARWKGFSDPRARGRAVLRRGVDGLRHALVRPGIASPPAHDDMVDGWLLAQAGAGRAAIYSAVHPVTADQLVTRDPSEARELGYGPAQVLGYALTMAPATGTSGAPGSEHPLGLALR